MPKKLVYRCVFIHYFYFDEAENTVNYKGKQFLIKPAILIQSLMWDVAKTILFFSHNLELTFLSFSIQLNWNSFNSFVIL
jgi:hypothetical protein